MDETLTHKTRLYVKKYFLGLLCVALALEPVRFYFVKCIMYFDLICIAAIIFFAIQFLKKNQIKQKKILITAILGVIIVNFSPIPRFLLESLESFNSPHRLSEPVDGVVILGGHLSLCENDNQKRGHVVYNPCGVRIFEWLPLLQKYPDMKIVFTGTLMEARLTRALFEELGINKNQVFIDENAKNTIENMQNVKHFIKKNQNWLLITSAFHMRRASKIFSMNAIKITPYPVNFFMNNIPFDKRILSVLDGLNALAWRVSIKEYAAILDLWIKQHVF